MFRYIAIQIGEAFFKKCLQHNTLLFKENFTSSFTQLVQALYGLGYTAHLATYVA